MNKINKCVFCKKEINKEDKVCPHCNKKQPGLFAKVLAGIIMVVVFIIIINIFTGDSSKIETKDVNKYLNVSEEGYMCSGQKQTLVAISEEDEKQMIKSSIANDNQGLVEMVMNGRAFFLDGYTKILVIDRSTGSRQIRVLTGSSTNRTGWVPMEFLCKEIATTTTSQ